MSIDKSVTEDLMRTLEDGKEGFRSAAEKLHDSDSPELVPTMQKYSDQREAFYNEMQEMAADYGDDVAEKSSVTAALHRGWMSLKDALTGSSAKAVLGAALQGEQHTVKEYDRAMNEDISPALRVVLERQSTAVRAACVDIEALHDAR